MFDAKLLAELLLYAAQVGGFPKPDVAVMPPIQMLSNQAMQSAVCNQNLHECDGIVAHYDVTLHRILMSDALDPDSVVAQSFLVHEMIHVLEAYYTPQAIQTTCQYILNSERQAYQVQNQFLISHGSSQRFGRLLNNRVCAKDQPAGGQAIKLDVSPQRPPDEAAFEMFMQDLQQQGRFSGSPR